MKSFLFLLLSLAVALSAMADSLTPPTETQKAVFKAKVEAAFKAKDVEAIVNLYCLDHTDPSLRQRLEKQVAPEMLKGELADATYSDVPPDAAKPYTLKGVTYSPNLTPIIALVVKFSTPTGSMSFKTNGPSSITMILGSKDGSLWNICAAPESHP